MHWRNFFGLISVLMAFASGQSPARASDTLRVGKAVPFSWTFTPLDIGVQEGIFEKYGLKLEIIAFTGDARLQQAMAADSIDIGIGSGPGMGFAVKGAPIIAVAAMANAPRNMALVLPANTKITKIEDLKGKRIGVTTVGSLTDWLAKRIATQENWGSSGVITVTVGGMDSMRAAMKTGQIDASITSTESAYALQEAKEWRLMMNLGDVASHFHTHVIFARTDLLQKQPDQISRFLKGWFETIAFMRENKGRSVEISAKVLKLDPQVIAKTYDEVMPMFSDDGHFDAQALNVLKKSFVELGILDDEPRDEQLISTKFVQVRQ